MPIIKDYMIVRNRARTADAAVDSAPCATIADAESVNRQRIVTDILRGILLSAAGKDSICAEWTIRRTAFRSERNPVVTLKAGLVRPLKTVDACSRLCVVMRIRRIRRRRGEQ